MGTFERLTTSQKFTYLKSKKEAIFAKVNDIYKKSKPLTADDAPNFRSQFERLDGLIEDFKIIQEEIALFEATCEDESFKFTSSEVAFYELVDTAKNNYLRVSKSVIKEPSSKESSHYPSNFLPPINLPVFSGDIEEFVGFYSLFESLVHNNSRLSPINKFQYLRVSLRGDALAVISEFTFAPENYPLAFEALKQRYYNKRRLASLYMKKVTSFSPLSNSSHKELQRFIATFENNFAALDKLEIPDLLDYFKLQLSLNALDPGSRRGFEDKHSSTSFPSYDDLIKFVTNRSKTAEMMVDEAKATPRPKPMVTRPPFKSNYSKPQVYSLSSRSDQYEEEVGSLPGQGDNSEHSGVNLCPLSSKPKYEKKLSCWNCKGAHLFSQCPKPRSKFCFRCGEPGFILTTCPKCNQGNDKGSH